MKKHAIVICTMMITCCLLQVLGLSSKEQGIFGGSNACNFKPWVKVLSTSFENKFGRKDL